MAASASQAAKPSASAAYLHNPAEPILYELVASHRMATRGQLERVAADVFSTYRDTNV